MKENFTITDKETGKVYWISRAHCVVGVIMFRATRGGQWRFLLEKRGPGCPDNIGKWCTVCGYLNWDETRKEAVIREAYEETGFKATGSNIIDIRELETIDDPKRDERQNISTRYAIIADYDHISQMVRNGKINTNTKSRGGEADEVSELKIFTQSELEQMDDSDFAFNHKQLIMDVVEKLKGYYV